MITIQYLEDSPELSGISPQKIRQKLKKALDAIPITHLLIGWHIPTPVMEACRQETDLAGVKLLRWQPLLTGDGVFSPRDEWRVVNVRGSKVEGYLRMPEFTFVCPNNPDAAGAIMDHLDDVLKTGLYDGFFLDRIRFPSPSADPVNHLGCFCQYCQAKSLSDRRFDLDFAELRDEILRMAENSSVLLRRLFHQWNKSDENIQFQAFEKWMHFRQQSITDFISEASVRIRNYNLETGLDCFSPGLTYMVGQDLTSLSAHADWIKIMTYAHTMGPAGLPFEINNLCNYLIETTKLDEKQALEFLSSCLRIQLPDNLRFLIQYGLAPTALVEEVKTGIAISKTKTLAGLELVEIPEVAQLADDQIILDHTSVKSTGVDGLSISWDLLHIPGKRLDLISKIWQ